MCISKDLILVMYLNSFLLPQSFGCKNAKIKGFEEKGGLSAVFIKLKCRWFHTGLADLKKHQTLDILLRADSLCIF